MHIVPWQGQISNHQRMWRYLAPHPHKNWTYCIFFHLELQNNHAVLDTQRKAWLAVALFCQCSLHWMESHICHKTCSTHRRPSHLGKTALRPKTVDIELNSPVILATHHSILALIVPITLESVCKESVILWTLRHIVKLPGHTSKTQPSKRRIFPHLKMWALCTWSCPQVSTQTTTDQTGVRVIPIW